MRHPAPFLLFLLASLAADIASASPRYFADTGMIIRPADLMRRAATRADGQARLIRATYPASPDASPVPMPEPCSAALLPLGGAALAWLRCFRPSHRLPQQARRGVPRSQ